MGPEAAAVLAHAPALVLELALARGDSPVARRQPGLAVGFLVEAGEVLAHDLVGLIALEALSAGVPARDDASRVEHVDRVIRHSLDERAKTRLVRQAAIVL